MASARHSSLGCSNRACVRGQQNIAKKRRTGSQRARSLESYWNMAGGTSNMRKHLQLGTGKSLFYWSERVSEYKKKKVCDREKKTDVFSEKGRVNEERTPRVPSCSPPHTHFSPPSLHVGSFCMSDSVIPGGQNGLSLFYDVPLTHFLPTSPLVCLCCVYIDPSRPSIAGLSKTALDSQGWWSTRKSKTEIITF